MTYRALLKPLLFAYPREFRQHYREQLFVDVDDALGEQSAHITARTFLLRTARDIVAARERSSAASCRVRSRGARALDRVCECSESAGARCSARGRIRRENRARRATLASCRRVLTEAGLLAVVGGTEGALFAWLELGGLIALPIAAVPRIETATIDVRVLLFILVSLSLPRWLPVWSPCSR